MATEQQQRVNWPLVVRQALAAGLVGAATFDLFIWIAIALPEHTSMLGVWQFIASAAIGPVALSSTSYAWLGLLVHVIVSVGWAGGYAYLASTRPFMNARWLISGLMYGIVVYVFMDLLLLGAGKLAPLATPNALVVQVLAHCVFFGLPVAFVVARLDRAA
ncbi:MAG: hypothetical protein KGN02_10480 [bacterium]|nr:hypothetical protein [bacterium]